MRLLGESSSNHQPTVGIEIRARRESCHNRDVRDVCAVRSVRALHRRLTETTVGVCVGCCVLVASVSASSVQCMYHGHPAFTSHMLWPMRVPPRSEANRHGLHSPSRIRTRKPEPGTEPNPKVLAYSTALYCKRHATLAAPLLARILRLNPFLSHPDPIVIQYGIRHVGPVPTAPPCALRARRFKASRGGV